MKLQIDQLVNTLNRDDRLGSAPGCAVLVDLLANDLGSIVNEVMSDNTLFGKCLENSYRHANGFDKIVLIADDNFKLRLHVFSGREDLPPAEHIHDHRWPFASRVVKGRLTMDLFEEVNQQVEEQNFHKYIYDSNKDNGRFTANYIGIRNLKCLHRERQIPQGVTYCMNPDEMHRIVFKDCGTTITLMLTGKPISETCQLFSNSELTFEQTQTQKYTEETLLEILNRLRNAAVSNDRGPEVGAPRGLAVFLHECMEEAHEAAVGGGGGCEQQASVDAAHRKGTTLPAGP